MHLLVQGSTLRTSVRKQDVMSGQCLSAKRGYCRRELATQQTLLLYCRYFALRDKLFELCFTYEQVFSGSASLEDSSSPLVSMTTSPATRRDEAPIFTAIGGYKRRSTSESSRSRKRQKLEDAITSCTDRTVLNRVKNSPLHEATAATYDGEVPISLLLEWEAPVNRKNYSGQTPLITAIVSNKERKKNRLRYVNELLKEGAHIDAIDVDKRTALHWAVDIDCLQTVKVLLSCKANPRAVDKVGDTPLQIAIKNHNLAADKKETHKCNVLLEVQAELLCYHTAADINDIRNCYRDECSVLKVHGVKLLNTASSKGYCKALPLILEIFRIDIRQDVHMCDKALLLAVQDQQLECVSALLKLEIRTKAEDMFAAVTRPSLPILEALLEQGASLDASDANGRNLLSLAVLSDNPKRMEMVKYLSRQRPVSVNESDKDGNTPLHNAARHGYDDIVEFLKENGALLSTRNKVGLTPFEVACHVDFDQVDTEQTEVDPRLLSHLSEGLSKEELQSWAQPIFDDVSNDVYLLQHLRNLRQETKELQEICQSNDTTDVAAVEKCLKNGADVEARDSFDRTPLMLAVLRKDYVTTEVLLKQGASVRAVDKDRRTALHHAIRTRNCEISRLLISRGAEFESRKVHDNIRLLRTSRMQSDFLMSKLINNRADLEARDSEQNTPLLNAVNANDLMTVKILMENEANIEAANQYGKRALHIACENSQREIVEELLSRAGASIDVNARDIDNDTPLMLAVQSSSTEIIDLLLRNGADATAVNNNGHTALHWACQGKCRDCVEKIWKACPEMIRATANDGSTPLHMACKTEVSRRQNAEIMRFLLNHGADPKALTTRQYSPLHVAAQEGFKAGVVELLQHAKPDQKELIEAKTSEGATPLMCACENTRFDAVKDLLLRGAVVNARDNRGSTVLHVACSHGNAKAIEELLRNNANVLAKDEDGRTPLHYAVVAGYLNIIDKLLFCRLSAAERRDLLDAKDRQGLTVLHVACDSGLEMVAEHLLTRHVDTHATDAKGETALHKASPYGRVVSLLLNQGVDVEAKNAAGETVLHKASKEGEDLVVQILIEDGQANVNASTRDGATSLHLASERGREEVVRVLLGKGADVCVLDRENGRSPLHYAAEAGATAIAKLLVTSGANKNCVDKYGKKPVDIARERGHEDSLVNVLIRQEEAAQQNNEESAWTEENEANDAYNISDSDIDSSVVSRSLSAQESNNEESESDRVICEFLRGHSAVGRARDGEEEAIENESQQQGLRGRSSGVNEASVNFAHKVIRILQLREENCSVFEVKRDPQERNAIHFEAPMGFDRKFSFSFNVEKCRNSTTELVEQLTSSLEHSRPCLWVPLVPFEKEQLQVFFSEFGRELQLVAQRKKRRLLFVLTRSCFSDLKASRAFQMVPQLGAYSQIRPSSNSPDELLPISPDSFCVLDFGHGEQ